MSDLTRRTAAELADAARARSRDIACWSAGCASGEEVYTLTIQGAKAGQAWFKIALAAECLGDRPMQTEKMVEVISGPK